MLPPDISDHTGTGRLFKAGRAAKTVIVIIEDELSMRRLLRTTLRAHGYEVREAGSGKAGLVLAATRKPDLILLDLGLPDMSGIDIISKVRGWWGARPIIILSAEHAESTKVRALELGADDYVTKPFAFNELLARIRVALRHTTRGLEQDGTVVFVSHGVSVDLLKREVFRDGVRVHLTPIEFRVLATLVRNAGLLVSRDTLLTEVWGPDYVENKHYLRTYLASLRQKLEHDPAAPTLLLTESGIGYRIAVESAVNAAAIASHH
jgi:two-component system KDP operon response regulator KdpE